ncbi:MAG: phenylacetic acid degradation operon negative regulatory protein PaaX [Bradyrhizobium sp.]
MKNRLLGQWIEKQLADRPLRANSLIITIYGDMIAPHGGTVWLGGLIRLVEPLGLNPRAVRTSVFRLSREKWLVSEQIGRRSYYSLTAMGRRRFEHAFHRIYDDAHVAWEGDWQVVLTPGDGLTPALRETLRKELLWEGYAAITPGVLMHPSSQTDALLDILQIAGLHDKVVVLQAKAVGALSSRPLKELVDQCWNLGEVAAEYQSFIERFRSVARALRSASALDGEQCFVTRTLLMHEFRRVQLRDPSLPRQLLPESWPGNTARAMCRDIYQLCWRQTETHLMKMLETADGPLPPAAKRFHARFGGIITNEPEPGGPQPMQTG